MVGFSLVQPIAEFGDRYIFNPYFALSLLFLFAIVLPSSSPHTWTFISLSPLLTLLHNTLLTSYPGAPLSPLFFSLSQSLSPHTLFRPLLSLSTLLFLSLLSLCLSLCLSLSLSPRTLFISCLFLAFSFYTYLPILYRPTINSLIHGLLLISYLISILPYTYLPYPLLSPSALLTISQRSLLSLSIYLSLPLSYPIYSVILLFLSLSPSLSLFSHHLSPSPTFYHPAHYSLTVPQLPFNTLLYRPLPPHTPFIA